MSAMAEKVAAILKEAAASGEADLDALDSVMPGAQRKERVACIVAEAVIQAAMSEGALVAGVVPIFDALASQVGCDDFASAADMGFHRAERVLLADGISGNWKNLVGVLTSLIPSDEDFVDSERDGVLVNLVADIVSRWIEDPRRRIRKRPGTHYACFDQISWLNL